MLSAFAMGEAPPVEELRNAQRQGKSAVTMRKERQQDQELLEHVCGEGCGCGTSKANRGGDPLKGLRDRDEEVRQHENQHLLEAGEFAASGPILDTVTASNGQSFVTGGKVLVNIGEVEGDPEKTIEKMNKVERASRKPAEPSDQDLRVAAEAATKRQKAERELAEKRRKAEEQGLD